MKNISKIEKGVDSLGSHSRSRRGKVSRKMMTVTAILISCFIITASGAYLTYFGTIETTANIEQAVVIGKQPGVWHNYNEPVEFVIPESSPGGETFCYKFWVYNRASIPVNVTFDTPSYAGITTEIHALNPITTLILENKDASWDIISGDGIQATLTFDTVANNFNYGLTATGLQASTEYAIIYYADMPDRFVDWGGDNPGALIDTFTTDGTGDCTQSNSVNLAMNLPSPPDANIDEHDYSGSPDNYAHAHGAKIWIVPTSDYSAPELIVWNPATYLFETDLIIYLDCNLGVEDYFCKLVEEITPPITMQSKQMIPMLICYTFDLHCVGNYVLTTTVDATVTP